MSVSSILTALANNMRSFSGIKDKLSLADMIRIPEKIFTKAHNAGKRTGYDEGYTAGTKIAEAKPYVNTTKRTSFQNWYPLNEDISMLQNLDTSQGTDFQQMFERNTSINILNGYSWDFSKGKNFSRMFFGCTRLIYAPALNSSSGVNFLNAFNGCTNLYEIPLLDLSSATTYTNIFYNCTSLTNVTITGTIKIKDNNFKVNASDKLTVESMMSFINAFRDNTGGTQYTVYFGPTNLAKLTDEQISVATNKNIKLA